MARKDKEGVVIVYPNRNNENSLEPDFWGFIVVDGERRRVELWKQPTGALSGFSHDLLSKDTKNIFDIHQ